MCGGGVIDFGFLAFLSESNLVDASVFSFRGKIPLSNFVLVEDVNSWTTNKNRFAWATPSSNVSTVFESD